MVRNVGSYCAFLAFVRMPPHNNTWSLIGVVRLTSDILDLPIHKNYVLKEVQTKYYPNHRNYPYIYSAVSGVSIYYFDDDQLGEYTKDDFKKNWLKY